MGDNGSVAALARRGSRPLALLRSSGVGERSQGWMYIYQT
jgi:hypothetical protein